jgi:hypothetical protein
MQIRSSTYNHLFLMTPGTACTAVAEGALIPSLDGAYYPEQSVVDEAGMFLLDRRHGTMSQLRNAGLMTDDLAASLFKFTTVRNPFDLLVTRYVRLRAQARKVTDPAFVLNRVPGIVNAIEVAHESPTFGDWVERLYAVHGIRRRMRRPLSRFVGPQGLFGRYTKDADYVMRFERLQSDFDTVTKRLGIQDRVEIPRQNVTPERDADYHAYYTPRARRIVEAVFRPELERFGHEF